MSLVAHGWVRGRLALTTLLFASCALEPNPSPEEHTGAIGSDAVDGAGDTTDAADGFLDAVDAADAADSADGMQDATDLADGADAADATDGSADATDGADASDGADAADMSDATDGTDATEAVDASDATDSADAADGTDGNDGCGPVVCPLGCVVGGPDWPSSPGAPGPLEGLWRLNQWTLLSADVAPAPCDSTPSLNATLADAGLSDAVSSALAAFDGDGDLQLVWGLKQPIDSLPGVVYAVKDGPPPLGSASGFPVAIRTAFPDALCDSYGAQFRHDYGDCSGANCPELKPGVIMEGPLLLPWTVGGLDASVSFSTATVTPSSLGQTVCGLLRVDPIVAALTYACVTTETPDPRLTAFCDVLDQVSSLLAGCPVVGGERLCPLALSSTKSPELGITLPPVTVPE